MERNMLFREIKEISLNANWELSSVPIDSEFGNPNRDPGGTLDETITISWTNQQFAERANGTKRVYSVIKGFDGNSRKCIFGIRVNNTGQNKYVFLNRFFIARLFYKTTSGQDTDCRASKGMNCIKWGSGNFFKKAPLTNDPKSEYIAALTGDKVVAKDYNDVFNIEISESTLQDIYNKVESQILAPQKTSDRRNLTGEISLEITFYWQEYKKGRWFGGTFSNFQSKPITMTFFPVKPTYLFFPNLKVPSSKALDKRIKEFKEKYTKSLGYGTPTQTSVDLQIGSVSKSEINVGIDKSIQVTSEIKSSTSGSLKAEFTIPIIDFIKWEGSVTKTVEQTEGIVSSYSTSKNLTEGFERSLQQTTHFAPTPKKGKTRRFFLVPVVEAIYTNVVVYTPVNRYGFATKRYNSENPEILLKIAGWDIEERFSS